jgi:hypothetical protein
MYHSLYFIFLHSYFFIYKSKSVQFFHGRLTLDKDGFLEGYTIYGYAT